jgi:hypothetical protein
MERARSLQDPHVFISYRSDDTGHAAGRLGEQLVQRLGSDRVFIDVFSIEAGDDFRLSIADAVAHTAIMLVLIGRNWIRASDGRRRLADPSDVLRIEIEEALLMQVHIVPVLVDDAVMPSLADLPEPLWPLSRRNAVRLRARMFRRDAEELLDMVAEYIDQRRSVTE